MASSDSPSCLGMGCKDIRMLGVLWCLRCWVLGRATQHHRCALTLQNNRPFLVSADVTKTNDPAIWFGLREALFQDLCADVEGVAVKEWMWVAHAFIAEVRNKRSFREIVHGDAHGQTQCEDPVDEAATELCSTRVIFVDMQRLGVHGQRGKKHIVHLCEGSTQMMIDLLSYL